MPDTLCIIGSRNNKLLKTIECKSGKLVIGCDVPPEDIEMDTVAHCGGDMGDKLPTSLLKLYAYKTTLHTPTFLGRLCYVTTGF